MWLWLTVFSAVFLGLHDIAKKQALRRNSVYWILLFASGLTVVFLSPFITLGCAADHFRLVLKAALVSASWISGLYGIKLLPITTVSTIKASRPMIVVIFSIILFGERLNLVQWLGVVLVLGALVLLGYSSKKEDSSSRSKMGWIWMLISVLTGSASALYDRHIITDLDPLFVQFWANVYIFAIMAIILVISRLRSKHFESLRWDWTLVIIAALITLADVFYFYALKSEGAMLSVISLVRRFALVVTFVVGALYFKEHKIRDKAISLGILLVGLTLLLVAS